MNIQNLQSFNYKNIPTTNHQQVKFCGQAPVERLEKDVFVGVRNLLIQESAFFREPEMLEFVKDYIAKTMKNKPQINIIDGACSKGYETYTLAMLLDKMNQKINITGFDIGKKAIEDAKKGRFFIKTLTGNKEICSIHKMIYAAFDDDYLVFKTNTPLSSKQLEYKQMFNEFFTEIPNKKKLTIVECIKRLIYKDFLPNLCTKEFQIKPEKAKTCKFLQGDIMKLDEIVPPQSADVLLFRNAFYHLTTIEDPADFKTELPEEFVVPAVEHFVMQIDKAVAKNGLFVLGEHLSDHTNITGKTLYKELLKHNFIPALEKDYLVTVWQKTE